MTIVVIFRANAVFSILIHSFSMIRAAAFCGGIRLECEFLNDFLEISMGMIFFRNGRSRRID